MVAVNPSARIATLAEEEYIFPDHAVLALRGLHLEQRHEVAIAGLFSVNLEHVQNAHIHQADAEAKSNAKLAQSLTPTIVELRKLEIQAGIQKAYAEKWQGGVPTTILPAQAPGYMLDMRGMPGIAK